MGRSRENQEGYCLVYTGDGKGKTTAAIGTALRAAGRGLNVIILQFIKSSERTYGEKLAFEKVGVEMLQLGEGFTWTKTPEIHREALKAGWSKAREVIESGDYDLIVLDEINNALAIEKFPIDDCLPLAEVIDVVKNRPKHTHMILTGRNAKPEIIEIADLVTEMKPVKHYYENNVPAVYGIEF
ncbi:cob(I)yrinic acid a,c-diamide adenosyltransferase [Anaerobacillus sp. MEB173]|uniref:cob(I)yrinic acid a,c-diamide adenosyltransferase n=1 Tax=Anaerobacillus sp. MEB173 TaxID=3383345 RepID=UPI003F934E13